MRYDNQTVLINDLICASTTWPVPVSWPVSITWSIEPWICFLKIVQNRGKTELSFHSNFLNWDDLIGSRPNIFNSELSNPITNLPESRFSSFLWSSIIQKSIKILIGRIQRTNQRPSLRLRKRWNGIYLENDPNPIC